MIYTSSNRVTKNFPIKKNFTAQLAYNSSLSIQISFFPHK